MCGDVFAGVCLHVCVSVFMLSLLLRAKLKLPQKTVSLWSWVNRPEELERFTNPLYEPNSLVIWPSVAPQSLLLWEGECQSVHPLSKHLHTHTSKGIGPADGVCVCLCGRVGGVSTSTPLSTHTHTHTDSDRPCWCWG